MNTNTQIIRPIADQIPQSELKHFKENGFVKKETPLVCPHCQAEFLESSKSAAHISLCNGVRIQPSFDMENRDLVFWGESFRTVLRRELSLPIDKFYGGFSVHALTDY